MSGVFPQCRQRVFRRVCGIGRCLSALCWLFGHEGVFASVGAALESDEPSVVEITPEILRKLVEGLR